MFSRLEIFWSRFDSEGMVCGWHGREGRLVGPRNKKSVLSVDMSPIYRILAGINTILLIESRLGKKSAKYWKNR